MAKCEHCGNEYDKTFEVSFKKKKHVFDSFECAIQAMAPECNHCHCRIIGHGVENGGQIFCCANCARESGENRLRDRI
jgi:hypothetical protein